MLNFGYLVGMNSPSSMIDNKHPFDWKPLRHTVFKDGELADLVHEEGIAVRPFLAPEQLEALRGIYLKHHKLEHQDGGMFYSVYSQDLDYRKQVDDEIRAVLQPTLDAWFADYKNVVNSFVIKLPGKASEFDIHQDTTALDEFRFSPLSVWIPLWDVTEENGAMCVVPRTHRLFSPYRGISFPFPFAKAKEEVRTYMEPVPVKAGEAVVFDPRILHNSLPNLSDQPRVALICGIFPSEARFNICYKENPGAEIEIYEQEDDFLIKYPNFLHHCHDRPVEGNVVRRVADRYPHLDGPALAALLEGNGIARRDLLPPASQDACNMIAEPDQVERAPIVPPAPVAVASSTEVSVRKPGLWGRLFGRGN